MCKLTDTHTHLHFDQFKSDLAAVIQRAKNSGIDKILTLGTDLQSSIETVKIAKTNNFIFAAVGIHPSDVNKSDKTDITTLQRLAKREKKIVAIGEIGLDLYWKGIPFNDQLDIFKKMIELSIELELPVVIHNRNAQIEMKNFFKNMGLKLLKGVMHSFSGTIDDANFYLDMGMFISFTGVITFKNFRETEVVEKVPIQKLLLETDCPFLTPVPHRGKRNEPAFVKYTANKLAEIHHISPQSIYTQTYQNAKNLFNW